MATGSNPPKSVSFMDEIPEEVWCRYCNGVYDNPLLLPCLHSFCTKCVQDVTNSLKGKLVCPVCATDVDSKDEPLLPNLLAQKRVTELKRQKFASRREPCGGCDNHPVNAKFKCTECEEFLCDDCIQAHKRVKFTKDHEILSLEEIAEREKKLMKETTEVQCHLHANNILEKFCVTCDVTVCKECQKGIHSSEGNHRHSSIDDSFDSSKFEMDESLRQTRNRIPELQKKVYEIIRTYGRVQNKVEDITWQIRKTSRHLIQAVKDKERKLLKELQELQDKRCEALIEEKEIMERKLIQTIDSCDFTDDFLRQSKKTPILMIKKIVNNRLDHLLRQDAEIKSSKMKVSFEVNEEPVFRAIDDAYGKLLIEYAPPVKPGVTSPTENTADTKNSDARGLIDKNSGSQTMSASISEPVLNKTDEDTEESRSSERRSSLPTPVVGKKGAKAVTKTTTATTFSVTTMDHKNKRQEVQVQLETPDNSIISAHVLDNKDGTYTVFYCPKTGEHNLYISLSNKTIKHGSQVLNIYGSFTGMRGDELALACKVLCLIRWQITPGMVKMKNNKIIPNPKVTFQDLGDPPKEQSRESTA